MHFKFKMYILVYYSKKWTNIKVEQFIKSLHGYSDSDIFNIRKLESQ